MTVYLVNVPYTTSIEWVVSADDKDHARRMVLEDSGDMDQSEAGFASLLVHGAAINLDADVLVRELRSIGLETDEKKPEVV